MRRRSGVQRFGRIVSLCVALLAASAIAATAGNDPACRDDRVDLRGDWGRASFSIELADTAKERAQGLMFRDTLPRGAGMLFVYDQPTTAAFWMKNTYIPLDIIFVDETGTVTSVHVNAKPLDLTPIAGGDRVFSVLEINAGLARDYGITAGTQLRHEIFSANQPVWPC